jgi:hypothetical protein
VLSGGRGRSEMPDLTIKDPFYWTLPTEILLNCL